MKFLEYTDSIDYGDLVILYISTEDLKQIKVTKDQTYQTKFGAVKHNELIGKPWGTKYTCKNGYVYLLYPTCELWSLSLPHRTQILYLADIARIVFELSLAPGKIVCESGTGSGSLTHSLVRAIAPLGHVHTVELHEERSKIARAEFAEHSISDFVTVYNRDVIENGFPESIDHKADAVFLDIPRPYECVHHVKRALKLSGGEFANFSPCIEQTQRTCDKLREHGFSNVRTVEVVNSIRRVKTLSMPLPEFGVDYDELTKAGIMPDLKDLEGGSLVPKQGVLKKKELDDVTIAECNYNSKSVIGRREQYGHTGYLTFASLPPQI